MKTKIMLFCVVILAVALIGLARPSASVAEMTQATIGSPVNPGPSVFEKMSCPESTVIQEAEQSQEQSQAEEKEIKEKQQQEQAQSQQEQAHAEDKQGQKAEKKKPVVVTIKEGEKHQHKITITEGDKVRTIIVDKPIVIKEGADKKLIFITPEDKEVTVLEGDPVHLEIMGDKLEFIKEGKVVKVGKDGSCFYVNVCPDVDVSQAVKIALKNIPIDVEALDIAKPGITWLGSDEQQALQKKLREIREKLKGVEEKKLDLREVDKALADLEKELEKMSGETSRVTHIRTEKPEVFTIEPKRWHAEAAQEIEPDIGVDIEEHVPKKSIRVVIEDKGSFSMCCQIDPGEKSRDAYERIVKRIKKDLPEGYTLEPSFEEESGLVCLKIRGPIEKGAPSDLVEKLADCIREETK